MHENIILIGFMGTGKTTVGRALTQKTGMPFFDTDDLIVQKVGKSIPDIFKTSGEKYFREMETKVIHEITETSGKILATGGGAIINPDNFARLLLCGCVIGLLASEDTLWHRLAYDSERPLLKGPNPRQKIEALYKERAHLYRQAHHLVMVDEKTPIQIAEEIVLTIRQAQGHQ